MTTGSLRAFARYAKDNGMESDAVSYYHRQKVAGRLVMVTRAGKELVDFEASLASLGDTSDPSKAYMTEVNERQRAQRQAAPDAPSHADTGFGQAAQAGPSGKNATYMQAKTAREVYDAKMAQLDYEREIGKLIKKQEVDSALFEISRSIRDGLTNCARRIAAEVSGLTTAEDCEVVIDREHRAILENMTRQFNERALTEKSAA